MHELPIARTDIELEVMLRARTTEVVVRSAELRQSKGAQPFIHIQILIRCSHKRSVRQAEQLQLLDQAFQVVLVASVFEDVTQTIVFFVVAHVAQREA